MGAPVDQQLRMPLHTDPKSLALGLDGLDDPILVASTDFEAVLQLFNRLVMQCVDDNRRRVQDRRKPAPFVNIDLLPWQRRAHFRCVMVDLVDVGMESAAEIDIEHLRAPANAKDRNVGLPQHGQCGLFKLVALQIDTNIRCRRPP